MNEFLHTIYRRTLTELDAQQLVRERLACSELTPSCHVLAIGKAAVSMAKGARAHCQGDGFLLTKHDHLDDQARRELTDFEFWEAAHPVPDQQGVAGTQRLQNWLKQRSGTLLVLLSGGASSLLVQPAPPLELQHLRQLNRSLLASGLPIESINVLRKHLSLVKGGQLGELLASRFDKVAQLVLSDVCGPHIEGPDRDARILSLVGSGPTVSDGSSVKEAAQLLTQLDLDEPFLSALRETPADLALTAEILADNLTLTQCAKTHLGERVMPLPSGWPSVVSGGIDKLAQELAGFALEAKQQGTRGVLVLGGEPTVELHPGAGLGGRCQGLALLFSRAIAGTSGVTLLAGSSDGTDGPTEYAGALVDGTSWARMGEALGETVLERHLEEQNSMVALESVPGLLLKTGPTGQNLNDLFLLGLG